MCALCKSPGGVRINNPRPSSPRTPYFPLSQTGRQRQQFSSLAGNREYVVLNVRAESLPNAYAKITKDTRAIHVSGPFTIRILQRIFRQGPNIKTISVAPAALKILSVDIMLFCQEHGIQIITRYERYRPNAPGESVEVRIQSAHQRNERVLASREAERESKQQRATHQKQIEMERQRLVRKFGDSVALQKIPPKLFDSYETAMQAVSDGTFALLEQNDARAAEILSLHFGLKDGSYCSLTTIGKLQGGITREAVRQAEERGLTKIREASR